MNAGESLKIKWMSSGLLGLLFLSACGQPNQLPSAVDETADTQEIIGGAPVSATDPIVPSTVGIVSLQSGGVICTGSLIAANMVLTAAHCTEEDPRNLAILFSTKIPQTQEEADKAQVRQVVAGRTSPLWPKLRPGQKSNWGDIAILRFAGALPQGYKPAKLLADPSQLKKGQVVTLAGFGLIDGRRQIDTDVLRKVDVSLADPKFSQSEVMFDQRAKKGACHGDSGGPAFARVKGELVLFGVTSRGYNDPLDTCEGFSIYTNASTYVSWIKSTIDALNKLTKPERIPQPVF
jgi:secreted trypsin-like serine protease